MEDGVVEVSGGRLRGRERGGVWVFSGVPYARSPEGVLRWRPPEPPPPWSGVREASEFGLIAPQPAPTPGVAIPGDPLDQGEDCLTLNVWTCSLRRSGGAPVAHDPGRPVMVWIHGGGFTSGSGASLLYRGGDLARNGDVVVVTVNYRLGALGFLGHPALAQAGRSEEFGNWGLRDQLSALRWVQENIAAFGGDPGNVTVFGESAGAMSISALLSIPSARGLFHRAILQSGPPYTHTIDQAVRVSEDLANLLGVRDFTRSALLPIPASELVEATRELQSRLPTPGELPLPFLPVIDGVFIPRSPHDAVAAGEAAAVPLMIGTNRDELTFFAMADARLGNLDQKGLLNWLSRVVPGQHPDEVVDAYRSARVERGEAITPRALWVAAGSDLVFRVPSLALAASQRAHQDLMYVYLFTWETPAFGGYLGSCHALEIPFVFGSHRHPAISLFSGTGPEADALSAAMQGAWTSFAHCGDPSNGGVGQWPAWDDERRATMVFGPGGGVENGPRNAELSVWRQSYLTRASSASPSADAVDA
ncbi:MAG: carboxylesterase/lipase family protein [Acidimicrobiales bacterium]